MRRSCRHRDARQAGADGPAGRARDLGVRLQGGAQDAGLRGLLEGGRRGRPTPSRSTATSDGHFHVQVPAGLCRAGDPDRAPAARDRQGASGSSAPSPSSSRSCRWPSGSLSSGANLCAGWSSSPSSRFLKFYAHELVLGQVNILFAVVATGALLAMKAKREVAGRSARRPRDRHQALRRALPALADRPAAAAVDRRGVRGPRPRPRAAGGALRVGRQRHASPRVVANGDGNHRAQPVDLRQRVARRQCSSAGSARASSSARVAYGTGVIASRRCRARLPLPPRRAVSRGGRGRPAPDADAAAVAAGLGLRLPDCDAGDRVSGELPRSPAASAARHHRLSPWRRSPSSCSIWWAGRPTTNSCGCRSSACVSSSSSPRSRRCAAKDRLKEPDMMRA